MSARAAEIICDVLGIIGGALLLLCLFAGCGLDGEGWEIAFAICMGSGVGGYGCFKLAEFLHDISE